jgi:glycosyltransferase involved in cell wall biosynthesis
VRVLQVIYQDPMTYPPTINTARMLGRLGAEVLCLGYRRGDFPRVDLPPSVQISYLNANTTHIHTGAWTKLSNVVRLRFRTGYEIRRYQPDLIIAYDHWGGWGVLPFLRRGRHKAILHLHDVLDRDAKRVTFSDRLMWGNVIKHLDKFDLVVVPEKKRAEYLQEAYRIERPIWVVANSPLAGPSVKNDALRSKIESMTGSRPGLLAVIVGNVGLLSETARALAQTRGPWHLAVIGSTQGALLEAMMEEGRRNGVERRIHLIPYTNYDTVRSWLPGCDVGLCVHSSSSSNVNWRLAGSASVKVQEYLGAGIPSIVSPADSFRVLATETGALQLVEDETADGICAALNDLEPGSAHHAAMSRAALAAHRNTYNYEAQLMPVLRQLGIG